tara:strand:- start:167 stop:1447 length:1281 start_codon:yes stop_codon:yes gene_type:complete
MLSESQERMLIVLENGKEDSAKKIFDKWNLDFAVIGKTTSSKNIELYFEKGKVANVPIKFLANEAPMYDRPWKKTKLPQKIKFSNNEFKKLKFNDVIKKMISNPNICSKQWIWEQYDHTVMGDTIQKPGGDAGVVRVHGTKKAVASSVDSSASYCYAHPFTGGKQVVCEAWRNLVSVGAEPIAITNCLNFGNPEKKENMGEFVECIDGINEASKYLNFPVVSGNVSFYNETKDKGIKPTPTIGGVGLIKDYENLMSMNFKSNGNLVLVIGKTEGSLEQSIFAKVILDERKGPPPEINLFNEKNNGETVLKLIKEKLALSVHDVSLGGIMIGALKMCIAGSKGIKFNKFKDLINIYQYFFSEDQGRYIIEVDKNNLKKVENILKKNSVHFDLLGEITEKEIIINDEPTFTVDKVTEFYKGWLYKYMS